MVDLIALVVLVRFLASRAKQKGYPVYLAVIGVVMFTAGSVLGFAIGAALGLELGVMLTVIAGEVLGAAAAFAVITALPARRIPLPLDELEETFR